MDEMRVMRVLRVVFYAINHIACTEVIVLHERSVYMNIKTFLEANPMT